MKNNILNLKIGIVSLPNTSSFNVSSISSSLPHNLNSILIGIMLGDGSLYRSSPTSNVRFEMSLAQDYKEYALELGELLVSHPLRFGLRAYSKGQQAIKNICLTQ
jgi:hypothetical protein